jgi:hypothetical protein
MPEATMTPHGHPQVDRLIEAALSRPLLPGELDVILTYVAGVGFSPYAQERARGRLAGMLWQGQSLRGGDMLSPEVVHFLWHVVRRREWPDGTSIVEYRNSLRAVILDPTSGVFVARYQGAAQLGVIRESRELRGPNGQDWVVVQYRTGFGFWVTGYQPETGLGELHKPQWSDVRWLRQPRHSSV